MNDDLGLAAERTHLAWRRTASAHLVAGLVLARLVDEPALAILIALLSVGAAGVAVSVAILADRHRRGPIGALAAATSAISVVAALGAFVS